MATKISKNDVGTVIRISVKENDAVFNASAATVKTLFLKTPNGVVVRKSALFYTDGTDGVCEYTTITGDLHESGRWSGQLYLEFPNGRWYTSMFSFVVEDTL